MSKILTSLIFALLISGCSKKAAVEAEGAAPLPVAAGEKASKVTLPRDDAIAKAVAQDFQSQNYDHAIGALAQAQMAATTEAQKAQADLRMREAAEELAKKAETDEKAREAYQNLGRIRMGR